MHEREIGNVLIELNRLVAKITDYQQFKSETGKEQTPDDGYEMLRATLDCSRSLEKLRRRLRYMESLARNSDDLGIIDHGQALGADQGTADTYDNPEESA